MSDLSLAACQIVLAVKSKFLMKVFLCPPRAFFPGKRLLRLKVFQLPLTFKKLCQKYLNKANRFEKAILFLVRHGSLFLHFGPYQDTSTRAFFCRKNNISAERQTWEYDNSPDGAAHCIMHPKSLEHRGRFCCQVVNKYYLILSYLILLCKCQILQ